jgi:thiol-disulfide isomerase/thioredoxin
MSLTGLRGKVVLIDFWTYSCINCQRTLPHVEAWYKAYAAQGLEIIGVHTPEFSFEHVKSNIASNAAHLGVKYPIAIDNNYGTWNAYENQYWPAEYLVDASGTIRQVTFGEVVRSPCRGARTLYTMVDGATSARALLHLGFTPGL